MRNIFMLSVLLTLNSIVIGQNSDSVQSSFKYVDLAIKEKELHTYFKENLIYPEYAFKNKISGTVWVSFTIDANKWVKNHVTNVHVVKGIHPSLDFAAISLAMSIPEMWDPPSRGIYDTVRFVYPVEFNLEKEDFNKVSDCFEQRIEELLVMDTMTLDSMLYKDRPVAKESYVHESLANNSNKSEVNPISEYIDIKGTVIELPEKCPLPMVLVQEIGTMNSVLTDINGEFSLSIKKNSEVKFSCKGYNYTILGFSKSTSDIEVFLGIYSEELYYSPTYKKRRDFFKFIRKR
jgi:TonB family protein